MPGVLQYGYMVCICCYRSMNENTRLGEIVEAVKELEQAIVKDTGIQSNLLSARIWHAHH